MTQVTLDKVDVTQVLDIVHQLRAQGYKQGQDFEFAFHQSKWDDMIGEIPKQAVFTFYNPALASWFALRYQ